MSEQQQDDEFRRIVEEAAEAIGGRIASDEELATFVEAGERQIAAHDDQAKAEGRRFLDEEQDRELIETWYAEAERCAAIDDAADFARRLIMDYRHDYGTICHAIAAAGLAMAHAVDSSPEGGITGFQAGAIGWLFQRHWLAWGDEPRKMLDLSELLYPQYDDHWQTITPETADWLKAKATELLVKNPTAHPDVRARWTFIAGGKLPAFVRVKE
jgi:hypothetical protein